MAFKIKIQEKILKRILIAVCCFLGVILLASLAAVLYINSLLGKVNYNPIASPNTSSGTITDRNGDPLTFDKDIFNILLIGVDSRAQSSDGSRSDSMILISIDKKTHKIIMTSFMRDMYLPITGHGENRINAAFAFGGVDLLLQTIQTNFDIKIDRYAMVDFFSFIDIIDKLGGINLDVTDAEASVMNTYIREINILKHLPENDGFLKKGGKDLLLNGKQALAYARIRYVGNADFQRTERQRTVLTTVFSKLKQQDIFTLNSVLNMLLPDITTNLTKGEITSFMLNSLKYLKYPVEQDRIPIEGSYDEVTISGMQVLRVNLDKNIAELKSKIYNR